MKKDLIVLMGAPGAGKGTFARMLGERKKYCYVETGALLRALPPDSPIGQMVARGELVPDDGLFKLMHDNICDDADVLLDGFPRTLSQAQWLIKSYAKNFNIHIIYLDIPESVIEHRLNKRHAEGSTRADDANTAIVQRRITTFWNITMPAIEWLRTAPGIKFSDVDVSGLDVNENFANIIAALQQ